MGSISPQSRAQLAGIEKVFFVEQKLVRTWPKVRAGVATAGHVLRPGVAIGELVGTVYTSGLDAEGTDGPEGPRYTQLLEGFYAGSSPGVVASLEAMTGKRYLVLLRYYGGDVVAAGDALSGLLFTQRWSTGRKPGERKGYYWKFEAVTATALAYLSSPFTVEGLGLVTPGQPLPSPAPAAGTTVKVRTNRGRLLAQAQPGQTITLTSDFEISISVT